MTALITAAKETTSESAYLVVCLLRVSRLHHKLIQKALKKRRYILIQRNSRQLMKDG